MKKVYSFALDSAMKAGMFNSEAFKRVLSDMDEKKAVRLIEAVIGCVDLDELYASIPKQSHPYDSGKNAIFESYNYFDDRVVFSYPRTDVKYFASSGEADKYTASGKYSWDKYKSHVEGEYVFEGQWTSKVNDSCSLSTWLSGVEKEEEAE